MSEERMSGLKFYSLGIVTEHKARKSDLIKVMPIEEISLVSGMVNEDKAESKIEAKDAKGVVRTDKVTGDSIIIAKWIPFGHSNRISSPDVRANETVIIFRYQDTTEYYWTTIFREPKLRRLEDVLYGFSNIPDGLVPFDDTTSYWARVNTIDKYVHIHTNKNDGEPFAYDIKLDTAKGNLLITDNAGNFVELDSPTSKATITTNNDVEVNTTRVVVNASESMTVNTQVMTVNASSKVDINTPVTNISKDVNIGGAVVVAEGIATGAGGDGSSSIGGEITVDGSMITNSNVNVAGSVNVSGNVTASGSVNGSNI